MECHHKIHCANTDAASNITGAVRSNRWNYLVCFTHKLNLIVTCSIDEVEDVKQIMHWRIQGGSGGSSTPSLLEKNFFCCCITQINDPVS